MVHVLLTPNTNLFIEICFYTKATLKVNKLFTTNPIINNNILKDRRTNKIRAYNPFSQIFTIH